jgi:hypothetical protein
MENFMLINVPDAIGTPFCVSADDGSRLHEQILPLLQQKKHLELSFSEAQSVISAFLNAAYGKLFGDGLDAAFIDSHVRLIGVRPDLVASVRKNAIRYYQNPEQHQAIWDSVVNG